MNSVLLYNVPKFANRDLKELFRNDFLAAEDYVPWIMTLLRLDI